MNICAITSLLFASSVTLIVAQTNYLSFVTEPVLYDTNLFAQPQPAIQYIYPAPTTLEVIQK